MQLSKDQIIGFLRDLGDHDKADQAEQQLPDQVDTEEQGGLLAQHGISVQDLLSKFGGKGLGKLL
jgi:hypothetical protein